MKNIFCSLTAISAVLACVITTAAEAPEPAVTGHGKEELASWPASTVHELYVHEDAVWIVLSKQSSSGEPANPDYRLLKLDAEGRELVDLSLDALDAPDYKSGNIRIDQWSQATGAVTSTGGLALLVPTAHKSLALFELDKKGVVRSSHDLIAELDDLGGMVGLVPGKNFWLILGSRRIKQFTSDFSDVSTWIPDETEVLIKSTVNGPDSVLLVSVKGEEGAYTWRLHDFVPSEMKIVRTTEFDISKSRHFLVRILAGEGPDALVLMPDLDNQNEAWNLLNIHPDGLTNKARIRLPQDPRKLHQTRGLIAGGQAHFFSIAKRAAWHSAYELNGRHKIDSERLTTVGDDVVVVVSDIHTGSDGQSIFVAYNYREVSGQKITEAAALIKLVSVGDSGASVE